MSESKNPLVEKFKELRSDYKDFAKLPKGHAAYALEEARVNRKHDKLAKEVEASKDKDFKVEFFQWQRARKKLSEKNAYFLNEYEAKKCTRQAECIRKMPSGAYPFGPGDVMPLDSHYDERKQTELYVFYPTLQRPKKYNKQQAIQLSKGTFSDEADAKVKEGDKVTLRFALSEKQFVLYFQEIED